MFEKLVSLVPYNPGLLHQLSFYSRRMREEAAIRRTGLVFMVLAFMIQFIAVLSPPQATVANSSNDIINGGFNTRDEAHDHCQRDTQGFQRLLHYYGISCAKIKTASVHNISSAGNDYYSVGRNPKDGVKDTPATIPGTGKVYWRDMSTAWGNYSFKALQLQNQSGKTFYIMYDCANLVTVGVPGRDQYVPAQPQPTPAPQPTPQPQPTPTPTPETVPTVTPQVTPCPYNPSLPANSPDCYQPCEYNALLPADSPECRPCDRSLSSADALACVDVRKTASNVTAGISDANNTTAKAGDVIIYKLYAQNKGKATVKGFSFQENLNDVLDYADATDLHGGALNNQNVVTWPPEDIAAGATVSRQITVKVKDPIPQTPVSSSDPMHFDLIMTNVYGNTVNIKLPGTPVKSVEVAAAKLPNTGPGETMAVITAIVIMAGYFYSRAQLLSRESRLAIKDNQHGAV